MSSSDKLLDQDLIVFIYDMLAMSNFVYEFSSVRNVVRDNDDTYVRNNGWFGKATLVEFVDRDLVLTNKVERVVGDNKHLNYDIKAKGILKFIQSNRKWLKEVSAFDLEFDKDGQPKDTPFEIEEALQLQANDDITIIDYEDRFSTGHGGLVYSVVMNPTEKIMTVVFRGTIGLTDALTDRDYRLNSEPFFGDVAEPEPGEQKPGTHTGFTNYLVSSREESEMSYIDRILACVNGEFEHNPIVAGKNFKLFVSGHSLGGALANLFAFRTAQLKSKGHESVKFLPECIKAVTFAAPCVGNEAYNRAFQELEKNGFLRHIRIANEGDPVPTNNIPLPYSLLIKGDSSLYTQNGVNLFLRDVEPLEVGYRNTKTMASQMKNGPFAAVNTHGLAEYSERLKKPNNQVKFEQTVEEIYKEEAGDFTA